MTQYVFDNAKQQAAQRFNALAELYDPITTRHLDAIGVEEGWHCLEIGGGSGTIATWLAHRVTPSGRVLVTDIDPRHLTALGELRLPNLEVQRHDIAVDPLPERAFELIHERLVLIHVRDRAAALHTMVQALKPGGWLVVEDFDPTFASLTWPADDPSFATLYDKMQHAVQTLLLAHGGATDLGRQLPRLLRSFGLEAIGAEGHFALSPGGSIGERLDRSNFEQVRGEAVSAGLITDREVDDLLARMDNPAMAVSTRFMFTTWGQRPH
jgi:ubiquinone/menaquinone biosynthesis C-methylase UbiE